MIKRVLLLHRDFLCTYVDHRRVTFSRGADARQSVLSSKCFELVSDKQTV